jgi:hypothetical protein
MKKYLLLLIGIVTIGCQKEIKSNPVNYLSSEENTAFKNKIVRYFEEMPKNTNQDSKWDTIHNSYYSQKANQAELYNYYKSDDGFIYFAIAKIAPSLKLKKVATIGKLKIEKDSIVYYEEICRTWKMEIPELKNKTKTIFDKVANNKSVTEYYTENSQPEFWIEFPDKMTYYDNKERSWKTK